MNDPEIRRCGDGWEYCTGECWVCAKARLSTSTSTDDQATYAVAE